MDKGEKFPSLADLEDETAEETPPTGGTEEEESQDSIDDLENDDTDEDEGQDDSDDLDEEEESDDDSTDSEDSDEDDDDEDSEEDSDEEDETDENETDYVDFYAGVNSALGVELEDEDGNLALDFGDVDPLSPEGVAIYTKHVSEKSKFDFENTLKKRFPEAFQMMLHQLDGGKVKDFIKTLEGSSEVFTVEEVVDSEEIQKSLIRQKYESAGNVSSKFIDRYIKDLEEDGDLEKEALEYRKEVEDNRMQELKNSEQHIAKLKAEEAEKIKSINDASQKFLSSGKINDVRLPVKARRELIKSLQGTLRVEKGKIISVREITPENLEKVLGDLYFGQNPDNLSKAIDAKARTKNAQRLRASLEKNKGLKKKGTSKGRRDKGGNVTLGELDF